ncbi:hypothetical protein NPIL_664541 [Nephila pilipes]|uniref:Uncharacterized protein n=1 Tax=Nephila pilipes TaxID=299642 RepID=A0A8X6QDU7_NEPPI|nr:hypothetical protein NPIL_664541 [Nephila pilipes]
MGFYGLPVAEFSYHRLDEEEGDSCLRSENESIIWILSLGTGLRENSWDTLPKSTDFPTCSFCALHPPDSRSQVALYPPLQKFACSSVFAWFLPEEGKVFESSICSLPTLERFTSLNYLQA